ncbi:MAG: hypothetical protein LBS50_06355 [Prevotellaceae bacterium]|jgi:C-terminal processing protease CtpA/Prc|nr:hypothetical protein [Prevotellaceae bacterium]
MKYPNLKFIISFAIFLYCNAIFAQQPDIYRVSKEQKMYEFSVVWKELSYNFANMDNCPEVNLDSLYRQYLPIITETQNDWEYCRIMQKFLCRFNNGHTYSQNPDYLYNYVAYPLFTTKNENGKVFIDKVCKIYSNLQKDDEILKINDLTPTEYIEKFTLPYQNSSNIETKKKNAKIGFGANPALNLDNEKFLLTIKRKKNIIENIEIPFICHYDYQKDTIKYQQILDFYNIDRTDLEQLKNIFIADKKNNFAYIKLYACNEDFNKFYVEKYDSILNFGNLILDLDGNFGGDGRETNTAIFTLTDKDSLRWFDLKTRINNAHYKAKAASRIYWFEPEEVTQEDKDFYYPYFYNNAYEDVENDFFANPFSSDVRYKGNIYVIAGENTASAAEQIALTMQQSKKVTLLGKTTCGALGQPLTIKLPSGINVFINTSKTFNAKGQDVSSGIKPDYQYDFSEIYKIENPQKRLEKFIEVIKRFEVKK